MAGVTGAVVAVRWHAKPVDATGEECGRCGDTPWINAVEVFATINGQETNALGYLCRDCAEQLNERDD